MSLDTNSTVHSLLSFLLSRLGLLNSRAPASRVIGSATNFQPGKAPRSWAAPGATMAAQALTQHWCPVTELTDTVPHCAQGSGRCSRGVKSDSLLSASWFTVLFVFSWSKALARFFYQTVSFGERGKPGYNLWVTRTLGFPKFTSHSHCLTSLLCYCPVPTLERKTSWNF